MSLINRRYKPRKRTHKTIVPVVIVAALICGAAFLIYQKANIQKMFEPVTITIISNQEANAKLASLMRDLGGDRATLLKLAQNYKIRLAEITTDPQSNQTYDRATVQRFEWTLMNRLIDAGEWKEAKKILPNVEDVIRIPQLENLAIEASDRGDDELQIRLEEKIQKSMRNSNEPIGYLIRSLRRHTDTLLALKKDKKAIEILSCLSEPGIQKKCSENAEIASEAANLLLLSDKLSDVSNAAGLQLAETILKNAKCHQSSAIPKILMEKSRKRLQDNKGMDRNALLDIEADLDRCRESLLAYPDDEQSLPECTLILGEVRFKLNNYDGCVSALSQAAAFAEAFNKMTPELKLRITRLRARANSARGAQDEAIADLKYLAANETDPNEKFKAFYYLSNNTVGEERIQKLLECWTMLPDGDTPTAEQQTCKADMACELGNYYFDNEKYADAITWFRRADAPLQAIAKDTDGRRLSNLLKIGNAQLKNRKVYEARKVYKNLVETIKAMSEEDQETLAKTKQSKDVESTLFKKAVREYANTYHLDRDRDTARSILKQIDERLPSTAHK